MLTVRTWQDAIGGGLLCIGCVEQRLGRELVPDDFSHALINEFAASQSERLRQRLAGKVFVHQNHLPRARAMRSFIKRLDIHVGVTPLHREPPAMPACRVSIRRHSFSCTTTVHTAWTSPAGAIERIDRASRLRLRCGDIPDRSTSANFRRRAAGAEYIMRSLLTTSERERFRSLCELPCSDHVLPHPFDIAAFFRSVKIT